jgi:hypothetical protein
MAGMRWHPEPTDDIWKQAHLAMVEGLGKRLWLSCDQCQHWVMIEVRGLPSRWSRHADTAADYLAGLEVQPLRRTTEMPLNV